MEIIEIKRWHEFREYVDADRQVLPVYWRGQSCSEWPLASTFERQVLKWHGGHLPGATKQYPYGKRYERADGSPIWRKHVFDSMRDNYLNLFKKGSTTLRGNDPANLDEDQWWALGRHNGLITPLLDWTEKPYIAAFFSLMGLFEKMIVSGSISFEPMQGAIYRLFLNVDLEREGLRIVRPSLDELGRQYRQWGSYTWLDSMTYFELEGFMNNPGREDLLTKFVISNQVVLDGLRDLDAHGINYLNLFPDLEGAAQFANHIPESPR